jgi:hypothetical protein
VNLSPSIKRSFSKPWILNKIIRINFFFFIIAVYTLIASYMLILRLYTIHLCNLLVGASNEDRGSHSGADQSGNDGSSNKQSGHFMYIFIFVLI